MEQRHPHADATYRILPHDEVAFAVEVTIPGTLPTKVTSFASQAAAEAWIAAHKQKVDGAVSLRRPSWARRR